MLIVRPVVLCPAAHHSSVVIVTDPNLLLHSKQLLMLENIQILTASPEASLIV